MILNPKTSSSKRIVPIPLFLNEFLVNYKSRYQIEDNNVFIITGNNKIPDPRTTQYRFTNYVNSLILILTSILFAILMLLIAL